MLCSSLLRWVVASSIHLSESRFNHSQIDGERSSRIILCSSYLVDLLSTKWCSHLVQKVTMLREAIIQKSAAQITPSFTPEPADFRIGFMAQDLAGPVQNSTSANITQLATVIPAANQPITPASYTPVIEETEDPDSASSKDDDEDSASSDNDNGDDSDNDNGDDNGDDDGDGGGAFASAGGGGAFAFAG
jgi:hypothetical protein